MAEINKSAKKLFIALGIFILIVVILYFGFREDGWFSGSKCDPNRNGYNKKGELDPKCKVEDPKNHNATPPAGSAWTPDSSFPIKRGSWGPKVKALQAVFIAKYGKSILPKYGADGRFGEETENALKSKFNKTEIANQAEYDAIVSPKSVVDQGGKNYDQLKANLGSSAIPYSAGVYVDVQGKNKNYVFSFWPNGQFFFALPKSQTSIAEGTYSDGGKRMKVSGDWFAYTEGNVSKNMDKITEELGE